MLRAIVCTLLVLACPSESLAATSDLSKSSKAFSFTFDLLTSLHFCGWARSYALEMPEDVTELMTNLMIQNNKFQQGLVAIQDYFDDPDEQVSRVAKGVGLGIVAHIEANKKGIEKLKQLSNLDPTAFKNFKYEMAERASSQKQAWELLSTAATYVAYVLVDRTEVSTPKGPIPFKITENERLELLRYLDKLFGDDLVRYYKYREVVGRGLKGNPDDQNWLILAVDHIRGDLSARTFEEAARQEAGKR